MKLIPVQRMVADDPHPYRILMAGRRFGKSHLAVNELARHAASRRPNGDPKEIAYIGPTYGQAKRSVWKLLKSELIKKKWAEKINESELTITIRQTGATIKVLGAENYDSLRGMGLDFVVLDEFAQMKFEAWEEAIEPTLAPTINKPAGEAFFIGTPRGKSNWAYDFYMRGIDKSPDWADWASWKFKSIDGVATKEWLEKKKLTTDPKTYRQEYESEFESYSGRIYYAFEREKHTEVEIPPIGPKTIIHIGMDFNIDPMSAIVCVASKDKLHAIDEIVIPGSNTQEMCDEIKNRYPNNRIIIYPDASGGAGSTKGISDHRILQQNKFEVKSPRKNPPVVDRINSVNAGFENMEKQNRLMINTKCRNMIQCLEKHTYKENTRIPDKNSGYDHMNDALGYIVHYLMPIKVTRQDNGKRDYFGSI